MTDNPWAQGKSPLIEEVELGPDVEQYPVDSPEGQELLREADLDAKEISASPEKWHEAYAAEDRAIRRWAHRGDDS